MTISDLISRLTKIMKESGPTLQVRLGRTYGSTLDAHEFFDIRRPIDGDAVFLVPSDVWDRTALKRLAEREAQR